ncbi:unnamed protein product [Laminaria digitata]
MEATWSTTADGVIGMHSPTVSVTSWTILLSTADHCAPDRFVKCSTRSGDSAENSLPTEANTARKRTALFTLLYECFAAPAILIVRLNIDDSLANPRDYSCRGECVNLQKCM